MDFTFGIITNFGNLLPKIIESIFNLNIVNYEIIIVGNYLNSQHSNIRIIPFEDSNGCHFQISKKKNIIIESAIYENIVFLHDYVLFDKDWYSGYLQFGNNFDICLNKILNIDETRYRDWCLWRDDADSFVKHNNYLIPYEFSNLTKMMYISGAYWVGKKKFMMENKLNENLNWSQGEDVEWSLRVRNKTIFKFNHFSTVRLLKYKDRIFNETSELENSLLISIKDYDNSSSYDLLLKNHINKWIYNK